MFILWRSMLCNGLSSALKFTYLPIFRFSLHISWHVNEMPFAHYIIAQNHPSHPVLAVKWIGFRLLTKLWKISTSWFFKSDIDECYVVFLTSKLYYSFAFSNSWIYNSYSQKKEHFWKSTSCILHITINMSAKAHILTVPGS